MIETSSARGRVNRCLATIDRLNPRLNAVITALHDRARAEADAVDAATERGDWLGVLHGMPVSVKDYFATAGVRTTMGSAVYADHVPARDSEVVRRLRAAGAVLVAKDNMHEFASGQTTQNPHFGSCRNPWDPKRLAGGSSGGSAVTVATGMAVGSVGTDAGGSVRMPASLCGVAGLRPTLGRISGWNDTLRDIVEFTVPGPLARHVTDVARMFVALAGYDPRDPMSVDAPQSDVFGSLSDGIEGLRVGVPVGPWFEAVDHDVAQAVAAAAETLAQLGARVEEITIPDLGEIGAHFDSIRWAQGSTVLAEAFDATPDLLGEDLRACITRGRATTGIDYADAVAWRLQWRRRVQELFTQFDVVASPTIAVTAPYVDAPPFWLPAEGTLIRHWPMSGNPSLTLPCGFDRNDLPIGVEVSGPDWSEGLLLRLGAAYQRTTDWHRRTPPLAA